MPVPVFQQVIYFSPWFPLPPGLSGFYSLGITASVDAPSNPSSVVLAGRLRQGATALQVGIGNSATQVVLVPTTPLSTMLSYFVDVQWVPPNTQPDKINWTTPDAIAIAPIVTSVVTLTGASIPSSSSVSLGWDFGACATTPAGANIYTFNPSGISAGFIRLQGLTGTLPLNPNAVAGTLMYLQGVLPISGMPGAGFNPPFTMGPIVAGAPLPLTAPTITGIQYDGGSVQVTWTAPTPPATGGAVSYDLVASAGNATTVFAASAGGGVAVLGAAPPGGWSVAGRVRIGPVVGVTGSPIAVLTQVPTVDQIAVKSGGAGVTARVTFPSGTPAGATAVATLIRGGAVIGSSTVSSSGGTADITASGVSGDGWQMNARLQLGQSGMTLWGPVSEPVAVLANAPAIADVAMYSNPATAGSWIVTVRAATPASPDAALVFALTQSSTEIGRQTIADSDRATFTLTQGSAGAGKIDGAQVATASLKIVSATATSPSRQATFIGATPTVISVQNIGANDPSGQPQGIQVYANAGGQAQQVLTIRLLAGDQVVASRPGNSSTYANLPLSQPLDPTADWRIQARWTGGQVDDATFGGWSMPISVLTATTTMTSAAYDNGQLALTIQPPQGVAPAQGAYLYAYKTSGGSITGTGVIGTRGVFPLTPGSDTWQGAAKPFQPLPSGGSDRTVAPSSAPVPLLITAPSPTAIDYDGALLAASWNVVTDANGNAATGAILEISDGWGSVMTAPAGAAAGQIAVALAAAAQGTAKLRVRATRTTANGDFMGAYCPAIAPLVAAPTPTQVTIGLDSNQKPVVNAVLTTPAGVPAGTTYQAWLMDNDHVVSGPVTAVTNQGVTSVSFSFAAAGVAGLSIVAQTQATGATPKLYGPRSARVPVLALAPSFAAVLITPASATQWTLDAHWRPPADGAAIVSYTLILAKAPSSVVAQKTFGVVNEGALSFAMSAVDATAPYTLSLSATSANGSTTPVATTTVWFAAAAFTAVAVGHGEVSAEWTAPQGPTGAGYQLSLLDSAGSVLATTTTTATKAGIDIAPLGLKPSGTYVLALAIQAGPVLFQAASDNTAKTRPVLLLAAPTGLAVTTDPASGKATLTWTSIGDEKYTVAFSDGRAPVAVPSASYPFTAPLAVGADLTVQVSANVSSAGVVSTGPFSSPLAMPTRAPALTRAGYDGATVSGAWSPVAGAAGYVATVLNAAGSVVGSSPRTAATSVAFAQALTAANGPFNLVVQAVTEAGSGLPSAALPLFRTAWFVSTSQPSVAPPNIYPAATMALGATTISIYLPPLAPTTITVAPVGAFNLQPNTDQPTKTALPYVLSFAPGGDRSPWTFSSGNNPLPAIRPLLQQDYVKFLQDAETAGASRWGIAVLQQAISRWMPQTFAETHYYAYGLNLTGGPGTGSVDLRQGLVLRVGFADYTNVWSGDANSWLNGFGGGSPTDFDVADGMSGSGAWQLSMDAFVATLTASGVMAVAPPNTFVANAAAAGVADAADLFFPNFPNPFYRLFFPRQLQSPTSTGSTTTSANFALASAPSFTALASTAPAPGANTPVAYFRGRAVLRVMIRVSINDVEVVVPLGTTVGNVLDRYGVRPPATAIQLTGVTLERAGGPGFAVLASAPSKPPLVYDSASRHLVRLDWSTMATYGGPLDATNLPLLHGDRIAF